MRMGMGMGGMLSIAAATRGGISPPISQANAFPQRRVSREQLRYSIRSNPNAVSLVIPWEKAWESMAWGDLSALSCYASLQ